MLSIVSLPALGILAFGVGVAIGIPAGRIGVFGLAIATGTLILMVTRVDRARPRERRNLLLSLFTFAYVVRFVFPAFVFYVPDTGYIPELTPSPSPIMLTPSQ